MSEDKYRVPKKKDSDAGHTLVKAALSSIPGLGGPAVELFQMLVTPPLERRRHAWMEEIASALRGLDTNRGLRIEELKNNKQFISTLMQASQIAIRTHQKEKRTALCNAVLNAALPQSPEDATQQMYLEFIDSFTEWHLRILKLFQKPPELEGVMMGGLSTVVERAFPELQGKGVFYDQIWRGLWDRGLVTSDSLHGTMSGRGLAAKRTSDFGDRFLSFVSAP